MLVVLTHARAGIVVTRAWLARARLARTRRRARRARIMWNRWERTYAIAFEAPPGREHDPDLQYADMVMVMRTPRQVFKK